MRDTLLVAACIVALSAMTVGHAQPYFVSPDGNDGNPGTREKPFATLPRAQQAVRQQRGDVFLRGGIYYLSEPLVFTAEDSGTKEAPVVFQNYPGEKPVLSGGVRLAGLDWQPRGGGMLSAKVPDDLRTEEIFVNGERQVLARYPNFDRSAQYFDGFAADAISPERVARWANPTGGYYHAMHPALWGDFTWRITGKDATGKLQLEGGWQNNRGAAAHEKIRFVENIFEELDAPGEWFLDAKTHTLYFYPPAGLDLRTAVFEATRLRSLVEFRGDEQRPVKGIVLRGLTFRQAARTVMENREPLLRSDWTIYRGGAVLFDGADDCALEDCFIDQVGGNGVFVNNYNRRVAIRGTHIAQAGANGICFVGDPAAARSALFNYDQVQDLAQIDRTPGPKTNNYPADCLVEDCLIHETGRVEKQTAGVEIDLAQDITVRHCSIYDLPRAGINIGDGCWGGHVIEYCDVFDTVKETGDHGSFNSWGRDRFWRPNIGEVNAWIRQAPDLPLLDVVKPIQLLNNRWRCDHGWDIDLDDGSSNYVIRNNLCLRGGIKNREGFRRVVENNIVVGAGYDPHVWYANSGDVFRRNIVWTAYRPAHMPPPPWGLEMDFNLVHDGRAGAGMAAPAKQLQEQSGRDQHSVIGDAQFVDAARGDYRVRDGSPGLALSFVNFPMDRFGVQKPELKAMARTPDLPRAEGPTGGDRLTREAAPVSWLGGRLRNIVDEGEMSAFGLAGVSGVLVTDAPAESVLEKIGARKNDVILSLNGHPIPDTTALKLQAGAAPAAQAGEMVVSRDQRQLHLALVAAGAELGQSYEAEMAERSGGASVVNEPAASGGALVSLRSGQAIRFSHLPAASRLAIRYASVNVGTIHVTLNDEPARTVNVHSSGSPTDSFLNAIVELKISADATLTVGVGEKDVAVNVDRVLVGDGDFGLPPDIWNLPPLAVAPGPYAPDWRQMARLYVVPEWWRDAKFGAWAHWDPQSMPEQGDWYARGMYMEGDWQYKSHLAHFGHPSEYGYKDICRNWVIDRWNPEELMNLYVEMGARYFMAMGVHHDNFDCWESKYQPWNSVHVGPKVDVVGTWEKVARRHGLRFGIGFHNTPPRTWGQFMTVRYTSDKQGPKQGVPYDALQTIRDGKGQWWDGLDPVDLYGPAHTSEDPLHSPYANQFMWRVDDAIEKYHPDVIYFDEHAGDSQIDLGVHMGLGFLGPTLAANYYNKSLQWNHGQMEAVLNLKGVGGRYDSFQNSPELLPFVDCSLVKSSEMVIEPEIQAYSFQTETTIAPWHYQAGQPWMTADKVIGLLMQNVCRNGTMLLNLTQHGRGDLDPEMIQTAKDIGAWLRLNSEAVYASRPFEVCSENADTVCYTRNRGHVYAALLNWNGGPITLTALRAGGATLGKVSQVELLGAEGALRFVQDERGLTITPDAPPPPLPGIKQGALATGCRVLRITHDKGWFNDDDPGATYPGWTRRCNLNTGDFNNDLTTSNTPGEVWKCSFVGRSVCVVAPKESGAGRIEIQIDGKTQSTVDLTTTGRRSPQQIVFEATGLSTTEHSIALINRGSGPVSVDALIVR